jgi:hypothetical protein
MYNETDLTTIIGVLVVAFSPIIVGLTTLIYIKNRQSKKITIKPRKTFEEIFGLK